MQATRAGALRQRHPSNDANRGATCRDIFSQSSIDIIKEGQTQRAANVMGVSLKADNGDSTLVAGGAGGTTLISGAGNDHLVGGPGAADTFVFKPSFGNDIVQNFRTYCANHDVIQLDHAMFADAAAALNAAHQNGSDVQITRLGPSPSGR